MLPIFAAKVQQKNDICKLMEIFKEKIGHFMPE